LTVTAPGRDIDHEKRQRQTTLALPQTVEPGNSRYAVGASANRTGRASHTGGQSSIRTSVAGTSSTFLDTEAIRIEEMRKAPSDNSRLMTISPTANIVSVGLRRGPPSSIGSSSIRPSSSVSQRAITPKLKDYNPTRLQFLGSSPLRFEASSGSLEDEPTPLPLPRTPTRPPTSTDSKSRYSSRSIFGPGDLNITAVLETTCRMMEKYLLSKNPFPTEPELLAVIVYIYPHALRAPGLMMLK
jgi:hypothetical protein